MVESKDINWGAIWRGYALSLAGTLVIGLPLFLVEHNAWLIAAAGTLSLFAGGFAAARRAKTAELLNSAFVGLVYFTTFVAFIFLGAISDKLPDPLPGLPRGDSTFFMAWPLVQLLASTLGGLVASRMRKAGEGQ
jgi:putative membrane protein (TIGR04086 family)